jgi:hypothetical protein
MCHQTSNQPEWTHRAQRRPVPVYHLCVLGVLCGYDNKSVSNQGVMLHASGIIHTTYAVGSKPGEHLDERPDSPPAGWNRTFFFTKMLTRYGNIIYKKDNDLPRLSRRKPGSADEV